jgi:hypothetical protein
MILNMPESMPIVIHENIKESRHIAASPRAINDTPFKERPNLQNQSDNSDPKVGSALW